jgi:hypothetical protein
MERSRVSTCSISELTWCDKWRRRLQRSMCSTNVCVRALSLRALLWLRTPTLFPGVPDAALQQFRSGDWTASTVDDVVRTLQQRLAATPTMAAEILRLVHAVVECVPALVRPEAVVSLWETALGTVVGQDELCAVRSLAWRALLYASSIRGNPCALRRA